ncbi:MAG: ribosome-associated translation inhibitor RaiA [Bdellovibrionota bacterium]
MQLKFTFKHLDSSEFIKNHTQESMDQIEVFLLKESMGHVTFSKVKGEFLVEFDVHSKQKHFHAKARHENIYTAVHEALHRLERQFIKVKKIYRNHKNADQTKEARTRQIWRKAA